VTIPLVSAARSGGRTGAICATIAGATGGSGFTEPPGKGHCVREKLLAIAAFLLALMAPLPAGAEGSAALLLSFNVKPGAKAQFEEALKQQMAARRVQMGSWRWLTWEYSSGELPRYCIASFGHAWADFDQPPETAQAEEGRLAAAAALSTQPPLAQYFEHLEEVSDFGSSTNVPTLAEISLFQLHYGQKSKFYAALREFCEAMRRTGSGERFEWFELRSGGETPLFMLLVPRNDWAAFDVSVMDFQERLQKTLGKRKAKRVFEQFTSAVKSHERSAVRLRLDLSLVPAARNPEP